MKARNLLLVASLTLSTLIAVATPSSALADDIWLGVPAYGGTGCPNGTASVSLSPDGKDLSILFDSYVAEAGAATQRALDRKTCNVAIPVHVPQGMSVSVFSIDYRGFNSLPKGAFSTFGVEYFFAGMQGPRYQKTFVGPQNQDYTLSNTLTAQSIVWSKCGTDVILRTNTSMMTRTNNKMEQAMSTVDSADINAGLIYHLEWKPCY